MDWGLPGHSWELQVTGFKRFFDVARVAGGYVIVRGPVIVVVVFSGNCNFRDFGVGTWCERMERGTHAVKVNSSPGVDRCDL